MTRHRRRHRQAGFTLVELLAALAVTAMIAGFVLGGFDLARRAWSISRDRDGAGEADAAAAQLRALLATAVPANAIDDRTRIARVLFEGRSDSLMFVTLSHATAFRGGLMRVRLTWRDGPPDGRRTGGLVAYEAVFRAHSGLVAEVDPVVLFRDVTGLSLRYFGATEMGKPAQWLPEWLGRDRMPLAVLAAIDLLEKTGPRRIVLQVPLRLAAGYEP